MADCVAFLLFYYSFIITLKVMVVLSMQKIPTLVNVYMHCKSGIAKTVNLV